METTEEINLPESNSGMLSTLENNKKEFLNDCTFRNSFRFSFEMIIFPGLPADDLAMLSIHPISRRLPAEPVVAM